MGQRVPLTEEQIAALAPVQTVAGRTGAVTLSASDVSGLGTLATQNANDVSLSGGTASGLTITGLANPSGSSDAANKGYVDAAAAGRGLFQSDIDCSTNPNYPTAEKGWQYCVTVAGKIGGASGPDVEIGDTIQAKANVSAGNHATVGGNWMILQGNLVGALRASSNLSDLSSASTAKSNLGLGSVTNDAQTKAAIVPNTVPSAGQLHVGNAGGTAFGVVSASGDATISSAGVITLANSSGTRSNLGLGSIATQAASGVSITGGSIAGITDLAIADGGTGASDAATALANLSGQPLNSTLTAIGSASQTNSRLLAINASGTIVWTALQAAYIQGGQITNSHLSPGTITNSAINASAGIAATKLGNGDVDNTELSYLNGVAEAIQTRLDSLKVETTGIHDTAPVVGSMYLDQKAQVARTINGLYGLRTDSGTVTLSVKINGTAVTGLSALSVTSTPQDATASALNSVAVNDIVTLEYTAVSSPVNLRATLKATRS